MVDTSLIKNEFFEPMLPYIESIWTEDHEPFYGKVLEYSGGRVLWLRARLPGFLNWEPNNEMENYFHHYNCEIEYSPLGVHCHIITACIKDESLFDYLFKSLSKQ